MQRFAWHVVPAPHEQFRIALHPSVTWPHLFSQLRGWQHVAMTTGVGPLSQVVPPTVDAHDRTFWVEPAGAPDVVAPLVCAPITYTPGSVLVNRPSGWNPASGCQSPLGCCCSTHAFDGHVAAVTVSISW
jgi:hypothetical protein